MRNAWDKLEVQHAFLHTISTGGYSSHQVHYYTYDILFNQVLVIN